MYKLNYKLGDGLFQKTYRPYSRVLNMKKHSSRIFQLVSVFSAKYVTLLVVKNLLATRNIISDQKKWETALLFTEQDDFSEASFVVISATRQEVFADALSSVSGNFFPEFSITL